MKKQGFNSCKLWRLKSKDLNFLQFFANMKVQFPLTSRLRLGKKPRFNLEQMNFGRELKLEMSNTSSEMCRIKWWWVISLKPKANGSRYYCVEWSSVYFRIEPEPEVYDNICETPVTNNFASLLHSRVSQFETQSIKQFLLPYV